MYPIFAAKALVVFFGMYYNDALPRPFRLLVFHAFAALLAEFTGLILNKVSTSNILVFNIFNLLDVWFMAIVAYSLLVSSKYKQMIRWFLVMTTLLWIYKMYHYATGKYFNLHYITYGFGLIIIYALVIYDHALFKARNLLQEPVFLLCMAVLTDYGCSIPLIGALTYLVNMDIETTKQLFYIGHVVNTLRYVLIAIAFYLYAHQANRGYVGQ